MAIKNLTELVKKHAPEVLSIYPEHVLKDKLKEKQELNHENCKVIHDKKLNN